MGSKNIEISTNGLFSLLEGEPENARRLLVKGSVPPPAPFNDRLKRLLQAKSMTAPELIAAADISKAYTYQLLRGERRAGRDVVLRISLALRLSVEEAQRLLTLSENSPLYPRLRRDAAIIFALSNGLSLAEVEDLLTELPEKTLYGGGGAGELY